MTRNGRLNSLSHRTALRTSKPGWNERFRDGWSWFFEIASRINYGIFAMIVGAIVMFVVALIWGILELILDDWSAWHKKKRRRQRRRNRRPAVRWIEEP